MRKQAFGDRQVSVIGLGSGEFGGKISERQAREFMDAYADIGGNLIDTGAYTVILSRQETEKAKRSSADGSQTAIAGKRPFSAPKAAIRRSRICSAAA